VLLPPGTRKAHETLAKEGWFGLAENLDFGGQGVPHSVATAMAEMWLVTNPSYSPCNLLTQGAIASIDAQRIRRAEPVLAINAKSLAADQVFINTELQNFLGQMAKNAAVPEAAIAVLGKGRVVWYPVG